MTFEAFELERNKREMLRTIAACREDNAVVDSPETSRWKNAPR